MNILLLLQMHLKMGIAFLILSLFTATCKSESLAEKYGMKLIHVIANRPRNIVVNERESTVFLACEINTNTKLTWFHNDKEIIHPPPYILDWKRKNSDKARGSVLMIRSLRGQHSEGKYDCIAQTPHGKIKATVNISIKKGHELPTGFPRIQTHPGNVHTERNSVDFHCCVSGKPPFRFTWYYRRNPIHTDELHEVSPNVQIHTPDGGVKYCSNLKVKDAYKPTGFYQCVVMNDIGQVVSKEAKIAFNSKKQHAYAQRRRRDVKSTLLTDRSTAVASKKPLSIYTIAGVCAEFVVITIVIAIFLQSRKKVWNREHQIESSLHPSSL